MRRKNGLPLALSLRPQHIKPDAWYYEEPKSVTVVVWTSFDRALSKGEQVPVQIKVPWHMLGKSLKRYRAHKRASVGKSDG